MYERRMGKAMTVVFVTYFFMSNPAAAAARKFCRLFTAKEKWLLPS